MIKQHTITVGFNDKDTKKQEFSTKTILSKIKGILKANTNGYTIRHFNDGGYRHNDNTYIDEKSITIDLMYIEDDQVMKVINILKHDLNQESILYTSVELNGGYV